ncbi:MAG: flagellar filament capping protein FliD [Verrucomicrobiota bacterium]
MDLGISGLASGFDWKTVVDQLTEVERAPERSLQSQQSLIQQRNSAFGGLKTQLAALQAKITALKDPALFDARSATSSSSTVGSATAEAGTAQGAYNFNVTQLATAAAMKGTANIGNSLSTTDNVSGVVLSSAGFSSAITAGTFTVNGKQVEIATTDTLQGVFDKINAATSGAVTGTYNASTDSIKLAGSSAITLGSATDTSNFLQVANLGNNGTSTITSRENLGAVRTNLTMSSSNLRTAINDGGSGAGAFKLNGVSISYNASSDTIADVLTRINNSTAGVTASYDTINDRFTLTNRLTGDIGVGMEDVTGNFLSATGLSTGTLERGKNMLYTMNGSGELSSMSNKITESSSGVTGLSVTALTTGAMTVTVNSNQSAIKTAIQGFVTEYNKTQSLIGTQVASSTDAKGKVTAGILADDSQASTLAGQLRRMMTAVVGSGGITSMDALGYSSSGNDDLVSTTNETKLDDALTNNLASIKELFSGTTSGLAGSLNTYLDTVIGESGSLVKHQTSLTSQSASIDTQIADMERWVLLRKDQMTASFVAMETAQQKINQQMAYLTKQFA